MANPNLCKFYAPRHVNAQRLNARRFPSRRPSPPLQRARMRRIANFMRRKMSYYYLLLLLPALFLLIADFPGRVARSALPALALRTSLFDSTTVRPGIAIVAVCMNRHRTLRRVLEKWKAVDEVDEIVIVDWASDPPLRDIVQSATDSRIKLLRVEGERDWVLSRAFNLAIHAASRSRIIRTDCDYSLSKGFVDAHPLLENGQPIFYAGNYQLARNPNEVHLNGAVFIRRADFFSVGGYDERIQTYGWDDEDLYRRLNKKGFRKSNINYAHVSHVPHDDSARAQHDVRFVQVEIDFNRLLLEKLKDPWTPAHMKQSHWSVTSSSRQLFTLVASAKPRSLKELNSPTHVNAAWKLALEQRLANDYQVPWDIMKYLDVSAERTLLNRLNKRAAGRAVGDTPRILFVHCMHGLGNRFRALGSAMSYANSTGRELVVIWETDAHISAKFSDLFETDMVVLPKMKLRWPFQGVTKYDSAWKSFQFFNYMEMEGFDAVKDKFIVGDPKKHMYFKSAYILKTNPKLTSWDKDNENLRSLRPVASVRERLEKLKKEGLSDMVGVHIRDRTLKRDIKNVNFQSEYGDKASQEMDYWRRKSSHLNFITYMHELVKQDASTKFYVATDTVNVISRLRREFPGRITTTERDCDGRDGFCIRYALTDMLALAGTRKILGSNWSSFTEAAERLGGKKALLAGRDFARDEKLPFGR